MWNLWSAINGTVLNTLTVLVGTGLGLLLGKRLPDRYQRIVLDGLGLITITLGIDGAVIEMGKTVARYRPDGPAGATYGAKLAMITVGSLLVGGLIGTRLDLSGRIERMGGWLKTRFRITDSGGFAEGFLAASVIFCVGPLTLLGCLQNGKDANPSLLVIKSVLDGFCSLALASSLGIGVGFSILTILGFQGGLSLLAMGFAEKIHPLGLDLMSVVGGVVLLGTAMVILEIKKMPVANYLPGIFLPPLALAAIEAVFPGALLPGG